MIEVCKASAGSGKTHKLTGDYILKLFKSERKDSYKHILAVTFTNKATDEMKQRIIETLHIIATQNRGDKAFDGIYDIYQNIYNYLSTTSTFKNKPQSQIESYIKDYANKVLTDILNDYSLFNISTIDKFFQQVLRSFAKEIGFFSSYNVELDTQAVLKETIDRMMDTLSSDDSLLKWMISLAIDSIESGQGWNPVAKLLFLGEQLFKESLRIKERELGVSMPSREDIQKLREYVHSRVSSFEKRCVELGETACNIIRNHNLVPEDFTRGSNSPIKYFYKLRDRQFVPPTPTFGELLNTEAERWSAGKVSIQTKKDVISAYSNGLREAVEDVCDLFEGEYSDYMTSKTIAKNILTLGVLDDVYKAFKEYSKEKNTILLSEANNFLSQLIDSSDTPFVYEKIGVRLDHYMIDEFQDTSTLQWDNLYPLLKESVSRGMDNLIVGDVKQSIYRWRNSDWNLLNSKINSDFPSPDSISTSLDTNWRSEEVVVDFNNKFFKSCGELVQSKYNNEISSEPLNNLIKGIYSNFEQSLPSSKVSNDESCRKGHVKISFLEEDWEERTLELLVEDLTTLRSKGRKYSDIAILVRTNKEGTKVAEYLLNRGYKIVSDESLLISSSSCVRKILASLMIVGSSNDVITKYILDSQLRNKIEEKSLKLQGNSLYNICEEIIREIPSEEMTEIPFIEAFMDCVLEYSNKNGQDIKGFLKWWDDAGKKRSLSAPEAEDAIRIITVHKSKGLGFKVVLAPFFDETLYDSRHEDKEKIFWCGSSYGDLDKMSLLPIEASTQLKNTSFRDVYSQEILYSYIDKINVAYVEFTRAKEELLIYAKKPSFKKDGSYSIKAISDILYSFAGEKDFYKVGDFIDKTENLQSIGSNDDQNESNSDASNGYFSVPVGDRLQLSLRGGDFFSKDGENGASNYDQRLRGVVLHNILSKISTKEDLEGAVEMAISEGEVSSSDKEFVSTELQQRLDSIEDKHWYDGTYIHKNELEIILPNGEIKRPDRVMIQGDEAIVVDYKFGNTKSKKYINQVLEYMATLTSMGYTKVSGYVWYIADNELVSC